jgi:hypothetical protein
LITISWRYVGRRSTTRPSIQTARRCKKLQVISDGGAPDFKVTKAGLILGCVENKPIGENLAKVLESEQIAKYKSLSNNIVLTDYLHFIWINKYGPPQGETDIENPKFRVREDRIAAVSKLSPSICRNVPLTRGDNLRRPGGGVGGHPLFHGLPAAMACRRPLCDLLPPLGGHASRKTPAPQ